MNAIPSATASRSNACNGGSISARERKIDRLCSRTSDRDVQAVDAVDELLLGEGVLRVCDAVTRDDHVGFLTLHASTVSTNGGTAVAEGARCSRIALIWA